MLMKTQTGDKHVVLSILHRASAGGAYSLNVAYTCGVMMSFHAVHAVHF